MGGKLGPVEFRVDKFEVDAWNTGNAGERSLADVLVQVAYFRFGRKLDKRLVSFNFWNNLA